MCKFNSIIYVFFVSENNQLVREKTLWSNTPLVSAMQNFITENGSYVLSYTINGHEISFITKTQSRITFTLNEVIKTINMVELKPLENFHFDVRRKS